MKALQHDFARCATGCALAFLWTSVLALPAPAETEPAQSAQKAPQADQDRGTLEEITVTAERRPEHLQTVPIAISAFSEKMLKDFNVVSTNELMDYTPGLNITRVNVDSQPFIRGVGTFTGAPGNESAVVTYVDGVYYPSPMESTYSYNSIDRVEVLKGPQGTLFGRNASGGAINIVTKDPSPEARIDASAGYANYDTPSGNFYGSIPITSSLGANLALYAQDQGDAWGTNVYNGVPTFYSKDLAARTKLLYSEGDWKVLLMADYNRSRDDATPALSLLPGTTTLAGIGKVGGFYDVNLNYPSTGTDYQYGSSLRIDRMFNWGTISSITAGRKAYALTYSDLDASPIDNMEYINQPLQLTYTEELQVAAAPRSKWQWIGGLFLYYDDAEENPNTQKQPSFGAYTGNIRALWSKQITHSWAPYSQVTIPIVNDATHLTLGLRYTSDTRDITYRTTSALTGVVVTEGSQAPVTWTKVTDRVALDHRFTSDIMGYVSYNVGFKSGNFNLTNPTQAPIAPEVNNAIQLGMKTELFNGLARLNWEAFYYHITDKQVQQRLPVGNLQTNAGVENHEGIDADLTIVPTDKLSIVGAVALLHAWYAKFEDSTFYFPCTTPTVNPGCAASVNGGGFYQAVGDATGKDATYAERVMASLSTIYNQPLKYGQLQFVGSVTYHDGFYFDSQNALRQPVYWMVNAHGTWSAPDNKYDVTLWGKNLANAEYYGQMQLVTYDANYAVSPPRTYGITFEYHMH